MFEELLAYSNENPKRIALVGVIALLLILGPCMLLRPRSAEQIEHPNGYSFVCQNPTCRNEFKMSVSEVASYRAKHPGEPVRCPKCGQPNVLEAGAKPRPTGPTR